MKYAVLIIRCAQAEAEKIQTALGNSFAWLSVPPDWDKIEEALKQNPIKVVVVAGGDADGVAYLIGLIRRSNKGVEIFLVSATPSRLATLVQEFPAVTLFNISDAFRGSGRFYDFGYFIPKIRANL